MRITTSLSWGLNAWVFVQGKWRQVSQGAGWVPFEAATCRSCQGIFLIFIVLPQFDEGHWGRAASSLLPFRPYFCPGGFVPLSISPWFYGCFYENVQQVEPEAWEKGLDSHSCEVREFFNDVWWFCCLFMYLLLWLMDNKILWNCFALLLSGRI